ncbi:MAG: hypothetical protein ACOYOF_18345, partial [Verrucomicrobiaceae bacterium]
MTFRDIPDIGLWLYEGHATPSDKLSVCREIIHSCDTSLEQIGKAACHIAYRYLEGVQINKVEVDSTLSRALEKCDLAHDLPDWLTTRWRGSLLMAAIYIDIHHGEARQLIELCHRMDAAKAVAAHPPNLLNQMRAMVLASTWHHVNDDTRKGQQIAEDAKVVFQEAVKAAQWAKLEPTFVLELAGGVRMVEAAFELQKSTPDMAEVSKVEPSEPFHSALESVASFQPSPMQIERFDGT